MARPPTQLPDDEIAYLGRQGMGAPSLVALLRARGIEVDQRTVGRRLERLRAAGWPGADAFGAAQGVATARKPKAAATPEAGAPSDQATTTPDPVGDLERLPAELLTLASRDTFEALREALRRGEVVAADKLATVLERFSRRLVEVRPPEKIEPLKDPTNVAARREIIARWTALRSPIEIAMPTIEAIEAHVAQLRSRSSTGGTAPA